MVPVMVNDVVKYCVCGMARNYEGKGRVIEFLFHVYGSVFAWRVERGRGTIVVRTPDIDKIYRDKKLIWANNEIKKET